MYKITNSPHFGNIYYMKIIPCTSIGLVGLVDIGFILRLFLFHKNQEQNRKAHLMVYIIDFGKNVEKN